MNSGSPGPDGLSSNFGFVAPQIPGDNQAFPPRTVTLGEFRLPDREEPLVDDLYLESRKAAIDEFNRRIEASREQFFEENPDLSQIYTSATDDLDDLEENVLEEDQDPMDNPYYRRSTIAISYVDAKAREVFATQERDRLASRGANEESLSALDKLVFESQYETDLREYMFNFYNSVAGRGAAEGALAAVTRDYDMPDFRDGGYDWTGMGDAILDLALRDAVFEAEYVLSDHQDYAFAPNYDNEEEAELYKRIRDNATSTGFAPKNRRRFFYLPFRRDFREIIQELHATQENVTEEEQNFINFDYLREYIGARDIDNSEIMEQYEMLSEWWEGLDDDKKADFEVFKEQQSIARRRLERELTYGFAPVLNLAISNATEQFNSSGSGQISEENHGLAKAKIMEAMVLFLGDLITEKDFFNCDPEQIGLIDINDVLSMIYGIAAIAITKADYQDGFEVKKGSFDGSYKNPGEFLKDLEHNGYYLDKHVPERIKQYSPMLIEEKGSVRSGRKVIPQTRYPVPTNRRDRRRKGQTQDTSPKHSTIIDLRPKTIPNEGTSTPPVFTLPKLDAKGNPTKT